MVVLEVCGVWCVCVTVRVWLDDISRWRRHVAGLRNTNVTRTGAEREYVVWISAGNRLTSPLCRLDSSSKRLLRPGSKISDGRVSCFDVWDPQRGKYEDYVTACALVVRVRLKYDGTLAETRFRLSAKRTSPLKSAGGASVQSTTGSRGVRIRGSNAGYTMFRGSVKSTGCPLHSPVSPSIPLQCITVCHHISTWLYKHLKGSCSLHQQG